MQFHPTNSDSHEQIYSLTFAKRRRSPPGSITLEMNITSITSTYVESNSCRRVQHNATNYATWHTKPEMPAVGYIYDITVLCDHPSQHYQPNKREHDVWKTLRIAKRKMKDTSIKIRYRGQYSLSRREFANFRECPRNYLSLLRATRRYLWSKGQPNSSRIHQWADTSEEISKGAGKYSPCKILYRRFLEHNIKQVWRIQTKSLSTRYRRKVDKHAHTSYWEHFTWWGDCAHLKAKYTIESRIIVSTRHFCGILSPVQRPSLYAR